MKNRIRFFGNAVVFRRSVITKGTAAVFGLATALTIGVCDAFSHANEASSDRKTASVFIEEDFTAGASPILLQPASEDSSPEHSSQRRRSSRSQKQEEDNSEATPSEEGGNSDQNENFEDQENFGGPDRRREAGGPDEGNGGGLGGPEQGENGPDGFAPPRRHGPRGPRVEEKTVPLPEALESAGPTDPIPLNQRDLFITADQVPLHAVYYKGSADKSTVPIILIHDKKGNKDDLKPLAEKLAAKGMAVLLPDLRGHGESLTASIEDFSPGGNRPAIRQNDYSVDSFNEADFEGMRTYDGLLWFQFLVWLHNEGKINIRKLVMVGYGFGGGIGASWVFNDWKIVSQKRGHFSKILILISPEVDEVFEKIGASRAKPDNVHYMIFVGNLDTDRLAQAEEIGLEIGKEKDSVPEDERKVKVESFKTEKQGVDLIKVESFQIPDKIIQFIEKNDQTSSSGAKWQLIKHFMEEN